VTGTRPPATAPPGGRGSPPSSPTEPPQSARKIGRDVLLAFVGERGQVGVTLTAEHFGATRNTARNALEEAVATRHLDTAMDGRRTMYFPRAA